MEDSDNLSFSPGESWLGDSGHVLSLESLMVISPGIHDFASAEMSQAP